MWLGRPSPLPEMSWSILSPEALWEASKTYISWEMFNPGERYGLDGDGAETMVMKMLEERYGIKAKPKRRRKPSVKERNALIMELRGDGLTPLEIVEEIGDTSVTPDVVRNVVYRDSKR